MADTDPIATAINAINLARAPRDDGTVHMAVTQPLMVTILPDSPKETNDNG